MARPGVIITGATGFLGGQLMRRLRKEYQIFAIGRRSPKEAGAPEGPGIHWFRVDIGHLDPLREVFRRIRDMGGTGQPQCIDVLLDEFLSRIGA